MGQTIQINDAKTIEHVLVLDTDRSLAGQDGEAYNGVEAARRAATFPGRLAVRIFESDAAVDHIFVMSNTVSVRRPAGWPEKASSAVEQVVSDFFRYYTD